MFGIAEGATIQNVIAQCTFDGIANNYGTIAGTMKGGTISNVEAAGTLTGDATYAQHIGGLVGVTEAGTTIQSSFAVNDITAQRDETVIGGLVGTNNGNLYNSYANTTLNGTTNTVMGGLVGENNAGGVVENCYSVRQSDDIQAFAAVNNGNINYCYFNKNNDVELEQVNYHPTGTGTLLKPGYYAMVPKTGIYGYMYYDNIVHDIDGGSPYIPTEKMSYANGRIDKWPGLLSVLNQWVDGHEGYTSWLRPTTKSINQDLPVLTFETGNAMGTTDGKFLRYSVTTETNNGLDDLLEYYGGKTSYIFLYGNATNVANVPGQRTNVFVNEDAVLLQKQGAKGDFINTTVGVTFDNSDHGQHSKDFWGNTLKYDWHLMSTPLKDAKLGITYEDYTTDYNYWEHTDTDKAQAVSVANSYLPDTERADMNAAWPFAWDFYTYYEPQYHWINFKRNINSHHHYDEPHGSIPYSGFEQNAAEEQGNLIQGRGYMAAIDKDTYLSNTGTLNNGPVTIKLTADAPNDDASPEFFTYDKGSNLIGNPYQAYLDLDAVAFGTSKGGTGYTKFYIYDAEQGIYVPYTVTQSKNTATPSRYIHPHQAFFVVTDSDDDFTFTYDMATASTDEGSYFRGDDRVNYPLVNLFVENEQGNRDLAIIEFNRPAIGGAEKINNLRNANFKIAAYLEGKNYGLLFAPEGTQRVPVHFRTYEESTYTLTWETMHGNFTSLLLVDNLTGTRTNMLTTDHYTFNGSVDDYAARFYITFNVTGVDELNGNEEAFAWFDGNDWIVTGKGQLQVVDVTGRVLQSVNVNGDQTRLNLDGYAAGVYVMRLTDGIKSVSQKIVVK